jgi:hypothetical protein
MFLLANYGAGNKMTWNDVAKFMRKRTSTQVRTHVQKFRNKTLKAIEELNTIISRLFPDEIKIGVEDADFDTEKRDSILIKEISKDYLKILLSASEMSKDEMDYTAVLIERKLVPVFISKIYNQVGAEEKMESSIKRMFSEPRTTAELMNELKR